MNIAIIGVGYVGLTTGTCFAEVGNNVICMDSDEDKINSLKDGKIPIYEPGMEELVKTNIEKNRLSFTTSLKEAVDSSEVIFIAVGTPTNKDNTSNLSYLFTAVKEIAEVLDSYRLIVIKSTVPVGTCRLVKKEITRLLKNQKKQFKVDIASNPEFLREGTAIFDFMQPDRIVIGTHSHKAKNTMKKLYDFYLKNNNPAIISGLEEAEMIKYVSNAFLATKISYINEVAIMCDRYNVDVTVVAKGMGLDKRIGEKFLNPGPGFGGSCFPKDTSAMMHIGEVVGYEPKIIKATIDVNKDQINYVINKIKNKIKKIEGKTITVLGIAFKPETDDIREAPAIPIIEFLIEQKAKVKLYDPEAMENCKQIIDGAEYCSDMYSACKDSEGIIVVTEWDEFKAIDFKELKLIVKTPIIIDLRNMYEPNLVRSMGFKYEGVGRK